MRIVVPGATAQTAARYLIAAVCGALLALAAFAAAYPARNMSIVWIVCIAVGFAACIVAGIALSVGAYRCARAIREAGQVSSSIEAAKRQQRLSGIGALIMFGSVLLQWPHSFFGVRTFPGQWALELLGIFGGLLLQLGAQAAYLKAFE